MSEAMQQAGLLMVPRDPESMVAATIPLADVSVRARVTASASRVTVSQRYRNTESKPLEAVYVFPLEEGAAVCAFSVTIDGRRLKGQVKPREEAFDDYDDALAEGHGAFLLDQERPNVFTASVGNLMPDQEVNIELTYVAELVPEGEGLRLTIPTTVSPRYVPGHKRDFDGLDDGDRVNPPTTVDDLPYQLDLEVEADLLSSIRSVESPSHRIHTEINGSRVKVNFSGDEGRLDRDFVLVLETTEPFEPASRVVTDSMGDRFVVASFRPRIEKDRSPIDAVFVVDCSGSMGGSSIEDARRTLLLCLRSLEEGDYFDIVRFGSSHESLFGEPRPYDDRSLTEADTYVREMGADLGGTEILRPLEDVVGRRLLKGIGRRVVLLTDGQVSNDDDVIALAREQSDTTRFFSFGLGAGASDHLIRGVARAGRGAAEMIAPGERIENKVLRHVRRMAMPCADDVRLDWGELKVEDVTPEKLPPLYPGDTLTVIARVSHEGEGNVRLTSTVGGEPFQLECRIAGTEVVDEILPTLWARRRVRELEEGGDGDPRRGSRQSDRARDRDDRKRQEIEADLVDLGSRYGLMSSATSYVVVDEREQGERAKESAELRRIPVALTKGWGGHRGTVPRSSGYRLSLTGVDFHSERHMLRCSGPEDALMSSRAEYTAKTLTRPEIRSDLSLDLLLAQTADGSWSLDEKLSTAARVDLDDLRKAAADSGVHDSERVLATALVLFLAEARELDVSSARTHILEKGLRWLERATDGVDIPQGHSKWEVWAGTILEDLRNAALRA